MRLPIFFASLSLLMTGCLERERPDTNVFVVNVPAMHLKGYNLKRDYNENGDLKPGAKAMIIPISSLQDLNKKVVTDANGYANLMSSYRTLRQDLEECNASSLALKMEMKDAHKDGYQGRGQ